VGHVCAKRTNPHPHPQGVIPGGDGVSKSCSDVRFASLFCIWPLPIPTGPATRTTSAMDHHHHQVLPTHVMPSSTHLPAGKLQPQCILMPHIPLQVLPLMCACTICAYATCKNMLCIQLHPSVSNTCNSFLHLAFVSPTKCNFGKMQHRQTPNCTHSNAECSLVHITSICWCTLSSIFGHSPHCPAFFTFFWTAWQVLLQILTSLWLH